MKRGVHLLAIGLVVALATSLTLAGPGTSHLLFRETPVAGGLSIAFVGDGFKEAELTTYGIAVTSLVNGLLEKDVYDVHQRRFNFYRVDVVDDNDLTENLCSPQLLDKLSDVTVVGDSGPAVGGFETRDLGVQHCWGGGNSNVLYTSKEFEAVTLAAGIPDLKAVVIVANARLHAGGAQLLLTPQQTTVVVVGAHASRTGTGPTWVVDNLAVTLFAHELGHALGLLDEYESLNTSESPPFQECRNIWKPDGLPQLPPAATTWPVTEKPIPWHGVLTRCCSPQTMLRCQAHEPDGICVLQDLETVEAYCSYVPHSGSPNGACYAPPECNVFPGAWEGAFYSSTGFYRASNTCRMSSMSVDHRFCPACREYLDIYLEHYGTGATTGPWPEDRCLAAGCPPEVPPTPTNFTPDRPETRPLG